MKLFLRCLPLFILTIFLLGCSDGSNREKPKASAKGKITLKGVPYSSGGTIKFELASDPTKFGSNTIDEKGEYSVPDVPVGDVLVSIENESKAMMMGPEEKKKFKALTKWSDPKKSGLKTSIKAGENSDVNFDLK